MKTLMLGLLAAATIGAAIPATTQTADAQMVRERTVIRDGHGGGWRGHRDRCRTIQSRTRMPGGRVVVQTRRICR